MAVARLESRSFLKVTEIGTCPDVEETPIHFLRQPVPSHLFTLLSLYPFEPEVKMRYTTDCMHERLSNFRAILLSQNYKPKRSSLSCIPDNDNILGQIRKLSMKHS